MSLHQRLDGLIPDRYGVRDQHAGCEIAGHDNILDHLIGPLTFRLCRPALLNLVLSEKLCLGGNFSGGPLQVVIAVVQRDRKPQACGSFGHRWRANGHGEYAF